MDNDLLVQEQWRVIDQSSSGLYTSALQSFGMDDTLCASVGGGTFQQQREPGFIQIRLCLGFRIQSYPFFKKAYVFKRKGL